MFGTMPGTLGGSGGDFEWSGCFPYPPTTSAELREYLGVDDSISPAIGGGDHLWIFNGSSTAPDTGSLKDSQTSGDFDIDVNTGTQTTDSCYGQGTYPVSEQNPETDSDEQSTIATTGNKTPATMDGTQSFLFGGIMQIDDLPGTNIFAHIACKLKNSTGQGWDVYVRDFGDVPYFMQFRISENNYGTQTTVRTPIPSGAALPALGVAFAFLVNLDVQAGLMKIMVSNGSQTYDTTSWSDSGTFDCGDQALVIGTSPIPGVDDIECLWQQFFAIEYSGSLDAEIGWDNMDNFLKYCDGYYSV